MHNGVKFILSDRFCQDDLDNCSVRQRAIVLAKIIHRSKMSAIVTTPGSHSCSVRPIAGNVHGNGNKCNIIDETPLPKRKKLQQ